MTAELAPFKNGEHNSERASTVDHDITSLSSVDEQGVIIHLFENLLIFRSKSAYEPWEIKKGKYS